MNLDNLVLYLCFTVEMILMWAEKMFLATKEYMATLRLVKYIEVPDGCDYCLF